MMSRRLRSSAVGIVILITASAGSPAQDTPPAKPSGEKAKAGATPRKEAPTPTPTLARATFGGGCFWCLEAVFERVPGVKSVVSGYAGGTMSRPSYEMVHAGLTGHAEVVRLVYDPDVVSYDDLLDIFWHCHDPTSLNRQGPDEGTQYRSIILYHDEAQKEAALASYRTLTTSGAFASPIVTQLVPMTKFYPAEAYHQDYYRKHRTMPYCRTMIAPKLQKLKNAGAIR